MKRYTPFKFEEAIDSVQDFDNLIEDLLKKTFNNMVDNLIKSMNSLVNQYENTRKDNMQSPLRWAMLIKFKGYQLDTLIRIYSQKSPQSPIIKKDDADDYIKKESIKRAKEVQDSYKARLHSKLFLILKQKQLKDVKTIKLELREFYDATFKFMFEDGSEFTLNSQITTGTSNKGTFFYRFPSIYQNIILPDGTKIKKQSEDWMLENFAGVNIDQAKQTKKQLDPDFEQKELRKQNIFFKSKMGIKTENGIIEIGNPVKIDIYTLRSTIKDIIFEPKLPELVFVKRTDGSDFYSSLDNEIRGKNKYKATIKYENNAIIEIGVTFLAREENMFKTGFNTTSKNIELHPRYKEFPSSGYFTSVSGRVIKIIKGVE